MSAPADLPFDLDSLPPAVREAFAAMQAKVAGLEAHTERQDYLIAELRHALYGKRSEQLPCDERQLAFEDLDECMYKILADTLAYLEGDSEDDIDTATKDAFLYYKDLHIKRQS